MKKLIWRTGIFLFLTAIVIIGQKTVFNKSNQFSNFIATKENQLWNSFAQHGISRTDFSKQKKTYLKNRKQTKLEQRVHPQIKQMFYTICRDFNIDPTAIAIQTVNQSNVEAWVDQQIMHINEPLFLKLSQPDQQFILAHELQHIIHNDHEDRYILDELMQKTIHDEKLCQDLLNQFYRFQEERADVLAALKNVEYAHAYESCMKNFFKSGDTTNPEHPKMSDRVALAQNIVNSFEGKPALA